METRICSNCGKEYPLTAEFFYRNKKNPNGLRYVCKKCYNKNKKKYYEKNKKEVKLYHQTKKHNISLEDFNKMFNSQDGKCAICGTHQSELDRTICIDHNHETDEVRGLLCNKCNFLLGNAEDDINILKKAIKYLKSYEI